MHPVAYFKHHYETLYKIQVTDTINQLKSQTLNNLVNERNDKPKLGKHTLQECRQSAISDGLTHKRDNSINRIPLKHTNNLKLSDKSTAKIHTEQV